VRPRLLLVLALVLALTACGGGTSDGSAALTAEDLVAIADDTAGQGSARFTFEVRMEGVLEEPLVMTGQADAELMGRRARSTTNFPLVLLGDPQAGDQTQEVTVIVDGSMAYFEMPFLASALQSPTPWISMDLANLPPAAADLRSLATGQNDASQVINYLRGATGEFSHVRAEEVGGVSTTRYEGTIDLDLAAERAPAAVKQAVEASRSEVESGTGSTELPTEVWVDDAGLVRRVRYTYRLPSGTSEAEAVFTTDLSDFGIEVDLDLPPPDQVTDIAEVIPAG